MTLPAARVRLHTPRPSYAAVMAELAPLAWWRLGESAGAPTAAPAAGSWPGTYLGTPPLGAAGLLQRDPDTALGGDGVGAYCSVAGPIALPLVGWSLAAWVRITAAQAPTGASYVIAGASVRPLLAVYEWGAGTFGVQASWRDSSAAVRTVTTPAGTYPDDGLPHLIAATHDGAALRIYVDGALISTTSTWNATAYAAQAWYIARFSATYWPAGATVDEPAIWNRALTAAELAGLYVAGAAVDPYAADPIECEVLHAVIRHGRDDPSTQPEADAATLDLVGVMPAGVAIGARVSVLASAGGSEYERFAGRITDVRIGWDSVDIPVGTIIAVGELADMGRRVIGDAPYPAELDGTRVNRAIVAAGVSTDPIRSDPGYLTVLPRDVDAKPALVVAGDAAYDGGGFVWQATDGAVLYADAFHRRAPAVALELVACDLPLALTWSQSLEGLANDVSVRYGAAVGGGDQPEVHADDPGSIELYGTHAASVTTRLAAESDAAERANLILARQAAPVWVLSALGFDLEAPMVDADLTAALLGLEVHDLVNVTGMPAGSPMAGAWVFVEGWVETIDPGAWRIELVVSDYCRTAPAPQWDDTDPAWTWDGLDPTLTWDATTCLPPFLAGYPDRWVDVPSSERWDTLDPSTEWDAWTGRAGAGG
jgi:hypothetical protein